MLHGCESLAPNIVELKRLCCNDQAMIRCICGTSHKEVIPSATLLQKLEILDITKVLQIWHLIMVWARDAFTTNDKHNKILQVWQSLVTENIENQRRAGLNVLSMTLMWPVGCRLNQLCYTESCHQTLPGTAHLIKWETSSTLISNSRYDE